MKEKPLLIVGIDPGTTTAYALLDMPGKIIALHSAKELSIDALIAKVTSAGIPVCVGCDKAKVPAFVERFAVQVSARLFSPSEDLRIDEKRALAKGRDFRNNHEMDALASAIFAFNRVESLFRRVDKFLESRKKPELSNKVKEIVVKKGMSISGALDYLTAPAKTETRIMKKVIEEKKLVEKDFLDLYNELKRLEKDNKLLQKQNTQVMQELKHREIPKEVKIVKILPDEKIRLKDKKIDFLNKELSSKKNELDVLKKEINHFQDILTGIKDKIVVKKLKNLGWSEFQSKKDILKISKGDVLLVDDPSEFSDKALGQLRKDIEIIIHKKDIPRKFLDLSFVFINSRDLGSFDENAFFAFVNKGIFEEARRSRDLLKNIIKAYKKERLT